MNYCKSCNKIISPKSLRCKLCSNHFRKLSPLLKKKLKLGLHRGKKHSKESKIKIAIAHTGKKQSEVTKKKIGLATSGKNHWKWKGGMRGYYQNIARETMGTFLNRKIKSNEYVHHLDFNYKNNDINNLHLFDSLGKHTAYHCNLRRIVKQYMMEES